MYVCMGGVRGKGVGWGGRLFEAGRLLTFSAFRMGAYSRWALIRGWALIRINTVYIYFYFVIIIVFFFSGGGWGDKCSLLRQHNSL